MALAPESIDRALHELLEQLLQDPSTRADFESSWENFGGLDAADMRRVQSHAEWFLLERPSPALQCLPIESAATGVQTSLDTDLRQALRESFPAILEVTSVRTGQGAWARDLFGGGEVPLVQSRFLPPVEIGDVLVGRVYPIGDQLYCASRAMAAFRNAKLLAALRKDSQAAHLARRGVVRILQSELELMFFEEPVQPAAAAPESEQAVERARQVLLDGGLAPAQVAAIFVQLRAAARDALDPATPSPHGLSALSQVLDVLGFETSVDLNQARLALLEAWPSLQAGSDAEAKGTRAAPGPPRARARSTKEALEAFDRGRAAGGDLERLFQELEADLGLLQDQPEAAQDQVQQDLDEDDPDQVETPLDEVEQAPDFPGVVGAMVEEYLWDSEREHGPAFAKRHQVLREFARWGQPIGVFENLTAKQLQVFACIWLPEWGQFQSTQDVQVLVEALRNFCDWADANHQLELRGVFETSLSGLDDSLPRIWNANLLREPSNEPTTGQLFQIDAIQGQDLSLTGAKGSIQARLGPEFARRLRPRDRLRGAVDAHGALHIYCVYPPQSASLERA